MVIESIGVAADDGYDSKEGSKVAALEGTQPLWIALVIIPSLST